MIIKHFETDKINLDHHKFILLYGQNEGQKKEFTRNILNQINDKEVLSYDEKYLIELKNITGNSLNDKQLLELTSKDKDAFNKEMRELEYL